MKYSMDNRREFLKKLLATTSVLGAAPYINPLNAALKTCQEDPNCTESEYQWLWAHHDTAQVMVNDIYIYGISPFCGTE